MRKDFDRAHLTAHDNVAILTMNHPEVLNAAYPLPFKDPVASPVEPSLNVTDPLGTPAPDVTVAVIATD